MLLIGPLLPSTIAQLEAAYTLHRYDLATDREALVESLAPRLRAIATRGDYSLPGELIRRFPRLELIASSGTGYDGIDVDTARALNVAVTNSPGVVAECVADMALGLIIMVVRRMLFQDGYVRAGRWVEGPVPLTGRVWGERIGILGLGRIGKAIARRAEAFRMPVAYHGRRRQDVPYRYFDDPVALAHEVRVLVCALPGREGTRGFVGRAILDALGPDGYFVNVSRGSCVDESYLVDALGNRRLAGAGLDVFATEPDVPEALLTLDNVVLQPHSGSGTHATREAMGQMVVDNLAAFYAGKPLISPV
ncbi:MAG TPA: 2-hydroxyacid dehydrogenase [Casimicrobiaceae bacterium]|nr:2-hydroxyacid dehydrogenase [Casimicrobiaceae bacterium]